MKLIRHVRESPVVVIDNATCHSLQVDKPPSQYAIQAEIILWLRRQGVTCDAAVIIHKPYEVTQLKMLKELTYRFDLILNTLITLRLPNPILFFFLRCQSM
jgi:hypothetical protein